MNLNDLVKEGKKALKENKFLIIPTVMNDIITTCDKLIAYEKSQAYEYFSLFDERGSLLCKQKIKRLEEIKAWAEKNIQPH